MNESERRRLADALRDRCGRNVHLGVLGRSALRLVLEPTGDRGRLDLVARYERNQRWTISDRGVHARRHRKDFDFVMAKLEEIGTPVWKQGEAIVTDATDASLVESIAQFVSNIEFIPVLVGLWSNDLTAA